MTSPYEYAFSASSHDVAQFFPLQYSIRDRYGPWVLRLVATALVRIGYFAVIFSSPGFLLWVYAVIDGIGAGIVYINSVTVANKWFLNHRATVAETISAGFSWGSIPIILL